MFGKQQTDVLVIGAGPSGLLSALTLAKRGVEVQIVDRHRRTGIHSYALALHPHSLAILDELGVAQEVLDQGYRVERIEIFLGPQKQTELSLGELGGKFPYALVTPQSALENALESELSKNGVRVRWNHRVVEMLADAAGFQVEIAKLDQVPGGYPIARLDWMITKVSRTGTAFVVGADGYHSFVRERLNIEYRQVAPPQAFSVYELDSSMDFEHAARVVLNDDATSVLWPMGNGRCRWSFQIPDVKEHDATLDGLNHWIRKRAPWFPAAEGALHWSSAVEFDRRLAGRFGRGRAWLVGDAAHLTSPVGAQSMNAGLTDAYGLGNTLSDILLEDGSMELLDNYEQARLAEWPALFGAGTALESAGEDDWVSQVASRLVPCVPATGSELSALLRQVGVAAV